VSRLAIVRALEALEDGDQAGACEILLSALEDVEPVGAGRYRCRACPAEFRWPGERDHHEQFGHLEAAA
jgi:hypothetical protein